MPHGVSERQVFGLYDRGYFGVFCLSRARDQGNEQNAKCYHEQHMYLMNRLRMRYTNLMRKRKLYESIQMQFREDFLFLDIILEDFEFISKRCST